MTGDRLRVGRRVPRATGEARREGRRGPCGASGSRPWPSRWPAGLGFASRLRPRRPRRCHRGVGRGRRPRRRPGRSTGAAARRAGRSAAVPAVAVLVGYVARDRHRRPGAPDAVVRPGRGHVVPAGRPARTGPRLAGDRHPDRAVPGDGARDVGVVPPPHADHDRRRPSSPSASSGCSSSRSASSWWVPVVLAAVIGAVLMSDVRNDLVSLPPLVGTGTELRRQMTWWRPLVQAVPGARRAGRGGARSCPTADTCDIRQYVHPGTVPCQDPSPLAVAARWRQADEPTPVARVDGRRGQTRPAPPRRPRRLRRHRLGAGRRATRSPAISFAADPVFPTDRPGARRSTVTVTPADRRGLPGRALGGVLQSRAGSRTASASPPRPARSSPTTGTARSPTPPTRRRPHRRRRTCRSSARTRRRSPTCPRLGTCSRSPPSS